MIVTDHLAPDDPSRGTRYALVDSKKSVWCVTLGRDGKLLSVPQSIKEFRNRPLEDLLRAFPKATVEWVR